jgi:hypothetical protein
VVVATPRGHLQAPTAAARRQASWEEMYGVHGCANGPALPSVRDAPMEFPVVSGAAGFSWVASANTDQCGAAHAAAALRVVTALREDVGSVDAPEDQDGVVSTEPE